MQLITQVESAHFRAAWQYVDRNYGHLFGRSLRNVTLTPDPLPVPMADGLYVRSESRSDILIRHRDLRSTAEFVEILVHELTHLQQFESGRAMLMAESDLENEAYPAGRAARELYRLRSLFPQVI